MAAIGTFRALYVPCQWADSADTSFMVNVTAVAAFVSQWYTLASRGQCNVPMVAAPMVKLSLPIAQAMSLQSLQPEITTKLAALGYRVADYAKIVLVTERAVALGYKGLNWNSVWSWVNCGGIDWEFHGAVHELGHSFGLPMHAMTLKAGQNAGGVLTIPANNSLVGETSAQGDDCSTMGYIASHTVFSSREQIALGWLQPNAASNGYAIYEGGDRTYTLTPLGRTGGALYAVYLQLSRFATSARQYFFEHRQPEGADTYVVGGLAGIQMRISGDYGCISQCWVDAHPGAYREGAFQIGESFTDDVIRMDVVGPGQIRLRMAGSQPANVPPNAPTQPLVVVNVTLQ